MHPPTQACHQGRQGTQTTKQGNLRLLFRPCLPGSPWMPTRTAGLGCLAPLGYDYYTLSKTVRTMCL